MQENDRFYFHFKYVIQGSDDVKTFGLGYPEFESKLIILY